MEQRIVRSLSSAETKLDAVDRANLAIATGCYRWSPMSGLDVRAIKRPRDWVKRQQSDNAIRHVVITETEVGATIVVTINDYLALHWQVNNYDWAVTWCSRNTSARLISYQLD